MKKLLAVFLSLFVVSSVAFAKPSVESDFATMSKADSQFLFQEGAKVASLDQAEMAKTEGKWVWNVLGAIAGGYAGGIGYLAGAGDNFTGHGFESSFIQGAVSGFFAPYRGVASAVGATSLAFASGWFGGWY